MKFKYKDFSKIKSKKDLYKNNKLKFPINKPVYLQTYLHHIMIDLNKIELLDDIDLPIYETNLDDLDGIMLASNNQNTSALKYLLAKYPKYINNTNNAGNNWIHLLEIDELEEIIMLKSSNINYCSLLNLAEPNQ